MANTTERMTTLLPEKHSTTSCSLCSCSCKPGSVWGHASQRQIGNKVKEHSRSLHIAIPRNILLQFSTGKYLHCLCPVLAMSPNTCPERKARWGQEWKRFNCVDITHLGTSSFPPTSFCIQTYFFRYKWFWIHRLQTRLANFSNLKIPWKMPYPKLSKYPIDGQSVGSFHPSLTENHHILLHPGFKHLTLDQ